MLLQTKSVLAHPVRLLQLFEATNHGHPLVCVNVVGGGYDFGKVKPFLQNLAAELPNFATLRDELQKSSVSVGKLVRRLSKAVSDPNPNPNPDLDPGPNQDRFYNEFKPVPDEKAWSFMTGSTMKPTQVNIPYP